MSDTNPTIQQIEKEIADLLLDKMEFSDMTLERAQTIAKFVLAHLPDDLTENELKQVLPTLDDEFVEIAGVVHKYLNKYYEENENTVKQTVHELIASGKLDEASKMMKEYFSKKTLT